MAEPSTHINYSFEDIQRYLEGSMSAAEMHDIEKAALQDSFLADAIEGFDKADLTTAQRHLNEINIALLREKKESKVVAFNKKTQWLNVAALIIVLAGIGVVASYFVSPSDQKANVAQVKTVPAKNEMLKDSLTDNVSTSSKKPDSNLFIAENKTLKKIQLSSPKKSVVENNAPSNANIKEDKADVASVAAPVQLNQSKELPMIDTPHFDIKTTIPGENADSTQYALRGKVSGLSVLPSTFSGRVIDQNGEPVPFATVRVNKNQAVATDAKGNFNLKTNADSAVTVTTYAIGYTTTTSSIQPYQPNTITLGMNNTAMNDVVITALGVKRPITPSDSAMPVGGWKHFNKYVTEQLNKDTTAESVTNPDDVVEVEFLIDKLGNPYNFKVVKPLDDQHNAKAIEIVKKGPKWTNTAKKKKARVKINF